MALRQRSLGSPNRDFALFSLGLTVSIPPRTVPKVHWWKDTTGLNAMQQRDRTDFFANGQKENRLSFNL
jgi:hypothetical protein